MNAHSVPPTERIILQGIVRDEISIMLEDGGGRPRDVARRVCTLHPDLVGRLGDSVAEEAITAIARKEFKKWASVGAEKSRQLVLPSLAAHLLQDLPASISVPSSDDDEDADPIYRPLTGSAAATIGELRRAIQSLWDGIANDRRKARALSDLLTLAVSTGANDEVRVDDALSQLGTCEVGA
jgi:hypothetical protein